MNLLAEYFSSLRIWIEDPILFSILMVCAGAMLGSLANVIIYRLPVIRWFPKEKPAGTFNLWFPRSRCPQCSTPLRWYHNIPILSWVMLKGRCGFCHATVSAQYPIIETIGAITGLACSLFASTHLAAAGILAGTLLGLCAFMIGIVRQRIALDLILYSGLIFALTAA